MRWSLGLLIWSACALAGTARAQELSMEEVVARALDDAPQVVARAEAADSMRSLATSAGRLPDPELSLGVDNLPIEGPEAWSTTADFMTMRTFGVMQAFPGRGKRRLGHERAAADTALADAELSATRLQVARESDCADADRFR